MAARVVQITDLHLIADPRGELKGVCTRASLLTVLDVLRRNFASAERLIVTGDLAHDELRETYEALRELLADWWPKLRLIPGNHDNRGFMRQVFGDRVTVVDDRNVFTDSIGGWRLIGLDSQLTGEVRGQLGPKQLEWLAHELAAEPRQSTAIFLHHPPLAVGTGWLDGIGIDPVLQRGRGKAGDDRRTRDAVPPGRRRCRDAPRGAVSRRHPQLQLLDRPGGAPRSLRHREAGVPPARAP